jgi:predicted negative regulator of RcsB-dependent stress response
MSSKAERDALKGPDEFTLIVRRILSWSKAHQRILIAGGTVLAVIVVVASVATWNRSRAQREAADEFRRAHAAYVAGRFTDAARAFDDLQRDYPSTAFGRFAILYQAHALRAAGKAAAAAQAYDSFLTTDKTPPEYEQLALLSLGQLREDAGKSADAVDLYQRASSLDGPYSLDAELSMARLQLGLGRKADAKATYERILPDASGDMKALVEARLAALNVAP